MNKQICIIILILTCRICNAQNLVPNPSFEDTIQCPNATNNLDFLVGWTSFRDSPDYFNSCANVSYPLCGVPINCRGTQSAHTGNSYVGISTYFIQQPFAREYPGIQLNQVLIPGVQYFVSAFICHADALQLGCSTNKFGFRFSTVLYNNFINPVPVDNFSHVHSDSIITDSINWIQIKGSFIADSAYQYLILGNFYDNLHADTFNCSTPNYIAYYYIDDVCVSTDSLTCYSPVAINEIKNEEDLVLFPNPFNDKINITAKRNELIEVSLYDVTSRKMFSQSFINSTSINTEQLAKGIYIYELRNKNGVIRKGKVVKE